MYEIVQVGEGDRREVRREKSEVSKAEHPSLLRDAPTSVYLTIPVFLPAISYYLRNTGISVIRSLAQP